MIFIDLKESREKVGLSMERIAVELSKSASTIRFWEAEAYTPNLS
ncbi:DNA-binding transcriptional regulator YiaG, XRE-type HTH domain [Nostoc flagelliforme CCNUN1]|uniref:DNA-binding transcriptional regulator YiaG, XRE-type HTH domain n=1 Tax=Nostoc flagelliforme CCNUN1 TaxID=2038116 RepID=A0A2K8T2I9_9NOSO|nr:DNA-binding transcriptional regulator YiaG, XRE-type HTH domain [Nostoc flagelliforme CCNUN1]